MRCADRVRTLLSGAALTLASSTALAQTPNLVPPPAAGRVTPFVSVTPFWQGSAGLDGGGDFRSYGAALRAGATTPFGRGNVGGLVFNYDYLDFEFSGNGALGRSPWGSVHRYSLSLPITLRGGDGWTFGVVPSVDWFRESGADWGDSISYGGFLTATKSFGPDRRFGLGVAGFQRIEETIFFPIVVVDWRINARWRVVNPLPAGPAGPAGLELDYRLTEDWSLGLGAAWRSLRFRLSQDGATPNGIGEERGVPVFLRLSRNFGPATSLFLYGGAVVGGELRLDDSNGNRIREVSFDPAPLLGATFSYRF